MKRFHIFPFVRLAVQSGKEKILQYDTVVIILLHGFRLKIPDDFQKFILLKKSIGNNAFLSDKPDKHQPCNHPDHRFRELFAVIFLRGWIVGKCDSGVFIHRPLIPGKEVRIKLFGQCLNGKSLFHIGKRREPGKQTPPDNVVLRCRVNKKRLAFRFIKLESFVFHLSGNETDAEITVLIIKEKQPLRWQTV